MKKIIPITELRDTTSISKMAHKMKEPIFVTKNGFADLAIMSIELYNSYTGEKKEVFYQQDEVRIDKQDINYGLINVACFNIEGKISGIKTCYEEIIKKIDEARNNNSKIIVFPELTLSSYSLGDLLLNDDILDSINYYINKIEQYTRDNDALIVYGAPLKNGNKLFNCAIVSCQGHILGVVPKSNIPDYNEYYEKRYFEKAPKENSKILINNKYYPFGTKLLFRNSRYIEEVIGVEICEDLWMNMSPGMFHSEAGAKIIVNLSASNETLHKDAYRKSLIVTAAGKEKVAYLYSSCGLYESTSDTIMSGVLAVADPTGLIAENELFTSDSLYTTIDLDLIDSERRKTTSLDYANNHSDYQIINFTSDVSLKTISRKYNKYPFIDEDKEQSRLTVLKANKMQGLALARRLKQIGLKDVVIGISGGLDSTIALLACITAMDYMGLDYSHIHAITMPCFGTTSRTKSNATLMCESLGIKVIEIDIKAAVMQHLKDIDHQLDSDVTFENAQARERTQILMDYCNKVKGIVVGTGDLSEIALGWSTYNGDHMSMYALNNTFTKTFIQEMTRVLANEEKFIKAKDYILDILNTPISPELLEAKDGEFSQKTEDIIGPYVLHDFFLYHFIYEHMNLKKVYIMALETFKDEFGPEEIKKWLALFVKRFFNNQFKRSCTPDGAKISEVSLSPRGDFRMPSDTSYETFLDIVNNL